MRESGKASARLNIEYFQGLNSAVSYRLAKKSEPVHMENARAPIIGVLEKRQGQAKKGTAVGGAPFTAVENYGLVTFQNDGDNQGVYRISEVEGAAPAATLTISVEEKIFVFDVQATSINGYVAPTFDTGWVSPNSTTLLTAIPTGYNINNNTWGDGNQGFAFDHSYAYGQDTETTYMGESYVFIGLDGQIPSTPTNILGMELEIGGKGMTETSVPATVNLRIYLSRTSTDSLHFIASSFDGTDTVRTYGSSTTMPDGSSPSAWNPNDFKFSTGPRGDNWFYLVTTTNGQNDDHYLYLDYSKVKVYYEATVIRNITTMDGVRVSDSPLQGKTIGNTIYIYPVGPSGETNIYYLSNADVWTIIPDTEAQNLIGGQADFAVVDGNLIITDGEDNNRYILSDGVSVLDSTDAGHIYNSPKAHKVAFYKNRIYLADFVHNDIQYPTTVVRSSYPVGIVALVNEDVGASGYLSGTADAAVTSTATTLSDTRLSLTVDSYIGGVVTCNGKTMTVTSNSATEFTGTAWSGGGTPGDGNSWSVTAGASMVIPLTDTKYIYSDTGMNEYDIYRGNLFIGTITVNTVKETSITAVTVGFALSASDEVWVHDTYEGTKQYRWQANPTSTGKDVKQYDTMKLSGGDEDAITLLETVGNVLFVGNKNTLMTWNDYNFENIDLRVGSVSTNGYIKHLGTLYFLHYTGVYGTTGASPTLLSRKVDRYIRGATKAGLEASCAGYKGLSVFFTLGDVTLYNNDGSTWKVLHDTCLEYHTGNQDWYVHTNVKAKEFETFIDTAGTEHLLMAHTDTGKYVKEFLTGSTDDGTEIFFQVDTQVLPLMSEFEWYINPISVILETDRGANMKCFMSPDEDQEFYALSGTVSKGVTILKANSTNGDTPSPVLGRHIRLSFRDGSKQLCRLVQVSIIFNPTQMDWAE